MKIALLTTDNRQQAKDYGNPMPYFGTAPAALLQGFSHLPGIEVHVISCIRQRVQSPQKLADNIYFHSVVVPKIGWMSTGYQGCIRALRKKLREVQPDIVHGQGTELDCGISAVFSGFPNVLTIHGNMRLIAQVNHAKPLSFLWLAARLEKITLPRTNGVVCITRYTRAAVEEFARQTWLLPNAVDESFFDIQATPDPATPPVGICVGTICPRKNQNEFIRALDPLAARRPFKMIFLGETPDDEYGREFLRLVQERPWCEHAGFANREKLKNYFGRASFLVLPTREDNCPMTVLEAMAAGVPVLASNVGGVPDLIEEERTGLFCDPARPETFWQGVERLLADAALRQRLAVAARTEAGARFHPAVIARRHVEIYREVLERR
jgi:glycosyltransferase involved in cell wall biosynthesis